MVDTTDLNSVEQHCSYRFESDLSYYQIFVYICLMDFLLDNLAELVIAVLAFIKVVVNLTPTEKDNQVFGYIDALINMIISDRIKTPKK